MKAVEVAQCESLNWTTAGDSRSQAPAAPSGSSTAGSGTGQHSVAARLQRHRAAAVEGHVVDELAVVKLSLHKCKYGNRAGGVEHVK